MRTPATARMSRGARARYVPGIIAGLVLLPPVSVVAAEGRVVATGTLAGGEIITSKVMDEGGNLTMSHRDRQGRPVDEDAVRRAAEATEAGGFIGKVERELADRLSLRAAEPVDVVYLASSPAVGPGRGDLAPIARAMAQAQEGIVAELEQHGDRVKYRARYAPIVVATSRGVSLRSLEARGDVERIFLERSHRPRLRVSKLPTVTQAVTVHGRGVDGAGVRVGIVEFGRIGSHPNLPSSRRITCGDLGTRTISSHKTEVAGVVQSNHPTDTGQAPGITLVEGIGASFGDADMMAATDCVIDRDAVAINMSFGTDTDGRFDAFARFVDATAYNTGRTIVVAVSNDCTQRMGSPEIAFNDLSVGSFSDRATRTSSDDRHSCDPALPARERHGAYLDPPSPAGDREQPDIVAPGHRVSTTTPDGGFAQASGTSFAAPHVTGLAGLLQDRSSTFLDQGERLRAIIMASARKNLEGAEPLSERDGAGGIRDAAADAVVRNGQSFFYVRPGGTKGFPIVRTFTARAGELVRVATVWAHKSPGGDRLTRPTTDLDLQVLAPGGAIAGSSSSLDNIFEITQFTAPVTGTYSARISNSRASSGAEHVGLAISRGDS